MDVAAEEQAANVYDVSDVGGAPDEDYLIRQQIHAERKAQGYARARPSEMDRLVEQRKARNLTPAGGDNRAQAAQGIQSAGVNNAAGNGGDGTVVVNNVDQSQSGGGTQVIPLPIDTKTDPSLAAPAQ